jgi:hypothetical protein
MGRDPILSIAAFLLVLGVFGAFVGGIGYWILGPMHRATRASKLPTQFFVSDFIWLVAQLQIAVALVLATPYEMGSFGWILLLAGLSACVVAMWWASVTALSRAGVRSPLRRGVFILVVVPIGTLGVVGTFFYMASAFFLLLILAQEGIAAKDPRMLLLMLPIAALLYASRRLNFWVLAGGDVSPPDSTHK